MRGTIIKRGDRHSVVPDLGRDPETGKRRREWHSGYRTKKAAERARVELLANLDRGEHVAPSELTVADYMRRWAEGVEAEGLSPNTVAGYRSNVGAHIIPRLGTVKLQTLTPGQVKRFYADLLRDGRRNEEGGLAPRTVQLIGTTLGKALSAAVAKQLIPRNPAKGIRKPTPNRRRSPKVWTAEQLGRFWKHVEGERLYGAFFLAGSTGMRRSEVLGLPWRCLELEEGRLRVEQVLVLVDNEPFLRESPKSAAGRRTIKLDPETVAVLRSWRALRLEERTALGQGRPDPDDLVFTDSLGEPLHPEGFSRQFKRHVRESGLPELPLKNATRHTHATILLKKGVHPKVVQERLGHSSVQVTIDTYSSTTPILHEEAAELAMAAVLGR